jgi:hypothetical protein
MARARKIRGRLSDPLHIELDEPVNDFTGPVEVVVRAAEQSSLTAQTHEFIGACADLGHAPSSEDIDEARREMWAGFPHDDV